MSGPAVCVLGLGLIGGSLMRAAAAAGRTVYGYNRSAQGAEAATADGFDATTDLHRTLQRAESQHALIVIAVPMPAVGQLVDAIAATAPTCPLTDVISVKGAVLADIDRAGLLANYVGGHPMTGTAFSGWPAGDAGLFTGTPWVVSVDDHVDPAVWAAVAALALDCGAFVVPARADEHDAAAAAISHLPHLAAEAIAATAASTPLAYALAAGSFRDGTRVAATAPDLVRAMCEANAEDLVVMLDRALELLNQARRSLAEHRSVQALVEAGYSGRTAYDAFDRPGIESVTVGADGWRDALAAAGRAGGVIRSALPVLGSPR